MPSMLRLGMLIECFVVFTLIHMMIDDNPEEGLPNIINFYLWLVAVVILAPMGVCWLIFKSMGAVRKFVKRKMLKERDELILKR